MDQNTIRINIQSKHQRVGSIWPKHTAVELSSAVWLQPLNAVFTTRLLEDGLNTGPDVSVNTVGTGNVLFRFSVRDTLVSGDEL